MSLHGRVERESKPAVAAARMNSNSAGFTSLVPVCLPGCILQIRELIGVKTPTSTFNLPKVLLLRLVISDVQESTHGLIRMKYKY